jgi:hypothetical protein
MKFLFNLQTQTLKISHQDHSLILDENHQFRTLGGIGFALDYPELPRKPKRWIIFKVYSQKIKVIYKTTTLDGSLVYYNKTTPYPTSKVVEVRFSEQDRLC